MFAVAIHFDVVERIAIEHCRIRRELSQLLIANLKCIFRLHDVKVNGYSEHQRQYLLHLQMLGNCLNIFPHAGRIRGPFLMFWIGEREILLTCKAPSERNKIVFDSPVISILIAAANSRSFVGHAL